MSTQIVPTISSDAVRTSTGYNIPVAEQTPSYESCPPYGRSNQFYRVKPPAGIHVSEIAEQKISQLRDDSVQKQARELIQLIQDILERRFYSESNRLPRLHLIEEDGCASIEWNFEYIRIGFYIDPDRDKSFYYVVSFRKDDDSYDSHSRTLWLNINRLSNLVNLAIQHS